METISTSSMGSTTSSLEQREYEKRKKMIYFYEPEPTLAERIFKFLKNKFGKSK